MSLRQTIPTPVSSRGVAGDKQLVSWANGEVMPVLRQLRDAANLEAVSGAALTTAATGVFTNLWASDVMPSSCAWLVEARVVGYGSAEAVGYVLRALFRNEAGVVSQVGTTVVEYSEESDASYGVRLQVSGQTVVLDVQDDAVTPTRFAARVSILHLPVG